MTAPLILAFQPTQGRGIGGGKSGKDDADRLPGFGDMLRDAPAAKEKAGRHASDVTSRWARFAERLDRTMPAAENAGTSADSEASPDGKPDEMQNPDVFRTNAPDAGVHPVLAGAQPPVTMPTIHARGHGEQDPARSSPRKALESLIVPGDTVEDHPIDEQSETKPRAAPTSSENQPKSSPDRKFSPDAFSSPMPPPPVAENAPAKEVKHTAAPPADTAPAKAPLPAIVLVERSFPAPAPTTVASLTQSLASDDTFAQAMSKTHAAGAPQGAVLAPAHTLKIELHPAELGTVTASLRLAGEQLSIELRVETVEAHRRLSSDSEAIVSSLRGLGYDIDKVTIVQPAAAATRQDAASSGTGGGQRGGEQLGSGSGGERSAGQQRGGGDARNGEGKAHAATSAQRAGGGVFI